jgi:hypothetical protein
MKSLKGAKTTGVLLASFVIVCFAILVTDTVLHLAVSVLGIALAGAVMLALRQEVAEIVRLVNYSNIGVGAVDRRPIMTLVSGVVFGAALSALAIAITWTYMWQISVLVVACYVALTAGLMVWAYLRLHVDGLEIPSPSYRMSGPLRMSTLEEDELLPEIPKPVYGVVNASQKDLPL